MTTYAVQPLPMTPGATLDIAWPWADWLPSGDTLDTYTLTPSAGVTVISDSDTSGTVTAWVTLDADTPVGARAEVRCDITTTGGRTDARVFYLMAMAR